MPPMTRGLVMEVMKVGEVPRTRTPVPVSSETALDTAALSPVEVNTLEASVKTNLEAVRAELVTVPVMVVAPVKVEVPSMVKVPLAWILPVLETVRPVEP